MGQKNGPIAVGSDSPKKVICHIWMFIGPICCLVESEIPTIYSDSP